MVSDEKLAAALLRLAAERFSNHGCNDFDVSEVGMTAEESARLWQRLGEWNGDPEEVEGEDSTIHDDWVLMNFLADQLDPEGK